MTDFELLIDFHADAERQGPGSEADTLQALNLIREARGTTLKVADIGCGCGAQTLTLAKHISGHITAVDFIPEFLEKLQARATALGVQDKISTLAHSMEDLPFAQAAYDLIWAEGAIYNMGFEAGIKNWKQFLKTGGHLAVSELTWTTHSRPSEIEAYWQGEYPEVDTASNKIKLLEESGYSLVGYFILPYSSWMEGYYQPIESRFEPFLHKHQHAPAAQNIVDKEKEEIRMYKQYKDYLSYGFYIAQKL